MSSLLRCAGAGLLGLELLSGMKCWWLPLPLGGSELAQIGIVFGSAFIACEILDLALSRKRRRHR
jgi:hypothetical protein